ncbi:hypothetical protein [Gymnodinialimonas hymeniacidonis]|uniref:hypothetical protein n=1 Tax=Gymnodinialimonas hymeniacidonis TaxID=3126508 RepID=UPI0034C60DCC
MLTASSLTLVRGFAVAWVLPPVAFGNYAVAIGLGAFAGLLVSFGAIETSWKRFVLQWAEGEYSATVRESRKLDAKMALRVVVPTVFGTGFAVSIGFADAALLIIAVGGFAWSAVAASAGASFLRASVDLGPLAKATMLRTSIALIAAIAGAYLLSWPGAIIGEVVGGLFFMGYVEFRRRMMLKGLDVSTPRAEEQPENQNSHAATAAANTLMGESSGRYLFAANLLFAAPIFLDRYFVSEIFGAEAAGTYGLLVLFNMAALTLSGIIDQRVGPQVLRMNSTGVVRKAIAIYAMKWVVLVGLVIGVSGFIAAVLVLGGPLSRFESEYALTPLLLMSAVSLAVCSGYKHLTWVLIAWNKEIAILRVAGGYLIVTAGILGFAALCGMPLWGYIIACAIARLSMVAALSYSIWSRLKDAL